VFCSSKHVISTEFCSIFLQTVVISAENINFCLGKKSYHFKRKSGIVVGKSCHFSRKYELFWASKAIISKENVEFLCKKKLSFKESCHFNGKSGEIENIIFFCTKTVISLENLNFSSKVWFQKLSFERKIATKN